MQKKKLLAYALIPAFAFALLSTGIASANGFGYVADQNPEDVASRFQARFEHQAEILGVSVDTVKAGWAEGKNMAQIAEENGITREALQEKMQSERKARMQENLNALVQKGVITQEQANQRLSFMESRAEQGGHMMKGRMGGRYFGGF